MDGAQPGGLTSRQRRLAAPGETPHHHQTHAGRLKEGAAQAVQVSRGSGRIPRHLDGAGRQATLVLM